MKLYMCERCGKIMKHAPDILVEISEMGEVYETHHICKKCKKELLNYLSAKVPKTLFGDSSNDKCESGNESH